MVVEPAVRWQIIEGFEFRDDFVKKYALYLVEQIPSRTEISRRKGLYKTPKPLYKTDDVASRWKSSLTVIETIDIITINDNVFYQETSI